MDISVIICTRDRPASLAQVLASAVEMIIPNIVWELIIVDNGSTDDVAEVIDRYKTRLPLHSTKCAEPGLSRARNHGVATAQGRFIIWTDDDVILDRSWLLAYSDAIKRRPDAALFGGKILPVLKPSYSSWFHQNVDLFSEVVSSRDLGPAELPFSVADGLVPFGANYAIRSEEQRQFLYDVNLGAGSGKVGEEVNVIRSILDSGHEGYWIPNAIVFHVICSVRQTTKYVVQRYKAQGATNIYFSRVYRLKQIPVVVLAIKAAASYALYLIARAFCFQRFWIKRLKGYAFFCGALTERLRDV